MIGESPIRSQRLPVRPPVDVAAATWPSLSSATAPTVPYLRSTSNQLIFFAFISSSWRRRSGVAKYSGGACSRPCSRENRSEEHTSELQSLLRHSSAGFCLNKKN